MISKESLELRKQKKQLGRIVRLLSYDPHGKSKIKVWLQRKCVALAFYRKKASYASYEVIDLDVVKTCRVTTPNSDPNKARQEIQRRYDDEIRKKLYSQS